MRIVRATAGALSLTLACGVALTQAADAPKPKKEEAKPQVRAIAASQKTPVPAGTPTAAKPETLSFTNDDLLRMFGPPKEEVADGSEDIDGTPAEGEGGSEAARAPGEKDPLQILEEGQKAENERAKKLADAERKVERAEKRIADLEKRSLQIRNPLLPRPAPPEDAEARKEWDAMDASSRVEANAKELEAAREALTAAQQNLQQIRSGS